MDLFVMKIKERLEDATLSFSERAKVRCEEPVHLYFGMLDCYIKIRYHKSLMHVLMESTTAIQTKSFNSNCIDWWMNVRCIKCSTEVQNADWKAKYFNAKTS